MYSFADSMGLDSFGGRDDAGLVVSGLRVRWFERTSAIRLYGQLSSLAQCGESD